MKIISVDYGKHLGVAVYDENLVKPVGVFNEEEFFSFLHGLDFDFLILGIPYNLKGEFSKKTFETVDFGIKLKKMLKNRRIYLVDERFTTLYGKKISGMKEKKYRKFKDVISAMEILNSYLSSPHLAHEIDEGKFVRLDEEIYERMKERKILVDRVLLDPEDERLKSLDLIFLTDDPYHFYSLKKRRFIVYFRKTADEIDIAYDLILKYKNGVLSLCP